MRLTRARRGVVHAKLELSILNGMRPSCTQFWLRSPAPGVKSLARAVVVDHAVPAQPEALLVVEVVGVVRAPGRDGVEVLHLLPVLFKLGAALPRTEVGQWRKALPADHCTPERSRLGCQ